jgi:hypothetical protein
MRAFVFTTSLLTSRHGRLIPASCAISGAAVIIPSRGMRSAKRERGQTTCGATAMPRVTRAIGRFSSALMAWNAWYRPMPVDYATSSIRNTTTRPNFSDNDQEDRSDCQGPKERRDRAWERIPKASGRSPHCSSKHGRADGTGWPTDSENRPPGHVHPTELTQATVAPMAQAEGRCLHHARSMPMITHVITLSSTRSPVNP